MFSISVDLARACGGLRWMTSLKTKWKTHPSSDMLALPGKRTQHCSYLGYGGRAQWSAPLRGIEKVQRLDFAHGNDKRVLNHWSWIFPLDYGGWERWGGRSNHKNRRNKTPVQHQMVYWYIFNNQLYLRRGKKGLICSLPVPMVSILPSCQFQSTSHHWMRNWEVMLTVSSAHHSSV